MKTRAIHIIPAIVAALCGAIGGAPCAHAAEAQLHAPAPRDTVVEKATLNLLESLNDLTKTANKLTDVVAKWADGDPAPAKATQPQPGQNAETPALQTRPPKNHVYIEDESDPDPAVPQHVGPIDTSSTHIPVFISDGAAKPSFSTSPGLQGEAAGAEVLESLWDLPQESPRGGAYIWIPDSVMGIIDDVLAGRLPAEGNAFRQANNDADEPDLNEKVNWRGSKIPLALPTRRLGRYDRKLYNWLIYPKGLWHLGLSANYGELDTENSELLSLMKEIDIKGKIYSIKPSVSYFLRNNTAVGIRLAFTKGDLGINSFKVDIDDDLNFDLHDIQYNSDSYSAAVFFQQYFGLSRRGRFAVFNEAELAVGSGNVHFIRPFDGAMRDTRTHTKSLNLNYSPGVSIMMMKNAAFNLSFGIFGFHLKTEKQWENGEECGSRTTSGINFRFNIFNINFGVAIII